MTKRELFDALWGKFEESREYVKDAKTADDISAESALKLIELSENMVTTVAQYVVDGLPIAKWNEIYVVTGLRRAAKLIESTLSEDEKDAIGELEQLMDDCSNSFVISVLRDIRDET